MEGGWGGVKKQLCNNDSSPAVPGFRTTCPRGQILPSQDCEPLRAPGGHLVFGAQSIICSHQYPIPMYRTMYKLLKWTFS